VVQRREANEKHLVAVLAIAFVLGIAVAAAVFLAWKSGVLAPGFHGALSALVFIVCPPFVLSFAIDQSTNSAMAVALVAGAMIFGNAFLYAGVAAGGYFLVTSTRHKRRS